MSAPIQMHRRRFTWKVDEESIEQLLGLPTDVDLQAALGIQPRRSEAMI
jgi:hypothetical protein